MKYLIYKMSLGAFQLFKYFLVHLKYSLLYVLTYGSF
jgi:hypothetical protein